MKKNGAINKRLKLTFSEISHFEANSAVRLSNLLFFSHTSRKIRYGHGMAFVILTSFQSKKRCLVGTFRAMVLTPLINYINWLIAKLLKKARVCSHKINVILKKFQRFDNYFHF